MLILKIFIVVGCFALYKICNNDVESVKRHCDSINKGLGL